MTRNEESIAHKKTAHVKLHGGRVVHSRNQKATMAAKRIGKNNFDTSDREFS